MTITILDLIRRSRRLLRTTAVVCALSTFLLVVVGCSESLMNPGKGTDVDAAVARLTEAVQQGEAAARQVWDGFTPEVQQDVRRALTPARVTVDTLYLNADGTMSRVRPQGATGSTAAQIGRYYYSLSGAPLFAYFLRIGYSYNGSVLTAVGPAQRWPEVYSGAWAFAGHIGFEQSGGANTSRYRAWTQGSFELRLTWLLIQAKYPWVEATVYGSGSRSYGAGG